MKSYLVILMVLVTSMCFSQKNKVEITVTENAGSVNLSTQLNGAAYTNSEIKFEKGDKIILKASSNLNSYKVQLFNNAAAPQKIMDEFQFPNASKEFEFVISDDQIIKYDNPEKETDQYTNDIKVIVTNKTNATSVQSVVLKISKGNSTPPTKETSNASYQEALKNYVENEIEENGYHYVNGQNIIFDSRGIIHIYMDEDLRPIYSYFPTTAKSGYDNFQFHIVSKNKLTQTSITIESTGELAPVPIATEIESGSATSQSGNRSTSKYKFYEYPSSIFGPYSNRFPFTITKTTNGSKPVVLEKEIKLLKTSRVSLNTGVIGTFLKNPENIATFVKTNGDTTLISDNPTTRGFLGLVLTFHIKPRNLNIKPRDMQERLGISVGTNINAASFNNFFAGLNIEITNGLFINGGVHFGQVNYVANYSKFKFGDDKFSGLLEVRKRWKIAPFLAINIDAGLFAKAFKNILSPPSNNSGE